MQENRLSARHRSLSRRNRRLAAVLPLESLESRTMLNAAPSLSGPEATLWRIREDQFNTNGTAVAALLSQLGTQDADGNRVGVAVSGVNNTGGNWEYARSLHSYGTQEAIVTGDRGFGNLQTIKSMVVSPDGQNIYTAGYSWEHGMIQAISRDPETGELNPVATYQSGVDNVTFWKPTDIAISPDGQNVYVTSFDQGTVVMFTRDADSGELTWGSQWTATVDGINALAGAYSVVVSPDGLNVYAQGGTGDALAVFSRDHGTGELSLSQTLFDDVDGVDGLDGGHAEPTGYEGNWLFSDNLLISGDGRFVYAGGLNDGVATFTRDADTGQLSFVAVAKDGADGVSGLTNVYGLALSGDGTSLYAAGRDGTLVAFTCDAGTGVPQFAQVFTNQVSGVTLRDPSRVAISPDGASVVVIGGKSEIYNDTNYVSFFTRNPATGTLTFTAAENIGDTPDMAVAFTSDGQQLYTGFGQITQYDQTFGAWTAFTQAAGDSDLTDASRLLPFDAKVRFVPDADFNGTATITVRAWDGTAGEAGGTADTTDTGGETAFGVEAATATIDVIQVPEAPTTADDEAQTAGNQPVEISILDNDTAPESNLDPTSVRIETTAVTQLQDAGTVDGDCGYRQTLADGLLYVVSNSSHALLIYDVLDPLNPVLLGTSDALTTSSLRDVTVSGSIAAVGTDGWTYLLDVSDPTMPQVVSHIAHSSGSVAIEGDTLAFAGGYFYVYDIADPASPSLLQTYTYTSSYSGGVVLQGQYLFAAGDSSFSVFDITTDSPASLKTISLPGSWNYASDLVIEGNHAYVLSTGYLTIFDITNPRRPAKTGQVAISDGRSIAVEQGYAYVATALNDGLVVLDVRDPAAPTEITHNGLYRPSGIALIGNYIYAAGSPGMTIVKVRNGYPDHGRLEFNTESGAVTYTASPGFAGTDTFAYSVAEEFGARSGLATVTVAVAAPPTADLIATYNSDDLPSILAPGDIGAVQLTLSNAGEGDVQSPFSIRVYLSKDGTLSNDDILIGALEDIYDMPTAGASGDYAVDVAVPGMAAPASYYVLTIVDPDNTIDETGTGDGETNNTIVTDEARDLRYRFGTFESASIESMTLKDRTNPKALFNVAFTLAGAGYGFATWNTKTLAFDVELHETDIDSALTITTAGGKLTRISGLTCDGTAGTIIAPLASLIGNITIDGTLSQLQLHGAGGNKTITIGPADDPDSTVSFVFDRVKDLSILSETRIGSIVATEWLDGVGKADLISAPSIDTIQTRGSTAEKLTGDFSADILVSDNSVPRSLNKLTIAGWLDAASIRSAGNIGDVTLGGMRRSSILAGVKVTRLPKTKAEFDTSALYTSLNSLTIKGIRGQASSFIDSDVAAWTISNVKLLNVDLKTGVDTFGLVAHKFVNVLWTQGTAKYMLGKTWLKVTGKFAAKVV